MDSLVLGLTGSFGSGCGTVAQYLAKKGFAIFSLANPIKIEGKRRGYPALTRRDSQNIGDELRKSNGEQHLASLTILEIENVPSAKSGKRKRPSRIVVKSIRNQQEARTLRGQYPNFFLINIDASKQVRWERVLHDKEYTNIKDFEIDDQRDSGENEPLHGQHVARCVDQADLVINNTSTTQDLTQKVDDYLARIENPDDYSPTPMEIGMSHAWTQAKRSTCLKRKVGAAIMDLKSNVASSGFNDVPQGTATCASIQACRRDLRRSCLTCSKGNRRKIRIQCILSECPNCGTQPELEQYREISKALDLCRAVHAEERAILQLGRRGSEAVLNNGAVLYTTTFPCLLCAKKIIEIGLREVVYVEPYPSPEAWRMLEEAKVELKKFEGIKARAFERVYDRT
ncbi:MAG: hypothetical protein ABIJ96_03575 [Elusimicrobiota bacterium]